MLKKQGFLSFKKISYSLFKEIIAGGHIVRIGDKNIADVLGLKYNKGNIVLDKDSRLIVAKLVGKEEPSKDESLIESEFEFWEIKYDIY